MRVETGPYILDKTGTYLAALPNGDRLFSLFQSEGKCKKIMNRGKLSTVEQK